MKDKDVGSVGGANTAPLLPNLETPHQLAKFFLGVGYDRDNVVEAVVDQCDIDTVTAGRIVDDEATALLQGGHA